MSNKYFSGRLGHYIFCDICGQACYASQAVKLEGNTGRGGLLVCPNDIDKADPGLIPYTLSTEKRVDWARINHQNTTNGAAPENPETSTALGS